MFFSQLTLATCFGTRCLHACIWHQVSRNISLLAPGRSVEGGNLPIDELMGVKAVDSIDLSERGLGTMSAIIISACIAGNQHLRKLELSVNELGNKGAKALASVIRDSPSLTSINLEWNKLGPEGAKALAPALRDSASLTRVDVRYNALGMQDKDVLRKAVEGRSGFELLL